MKFNILLVSIFIFQIIGAQTNKQNVLVEYNLTYRPSKIDTTDVRSERFYLFIEKNNSEFISKNKYISDSIAAKSNNIADVYNLPKSKFSYRILKNLRNSIMIYKNDFGIYKYKYSKPLPALNWKLLNTKDTVAGQVCDLAITNFGGRDYTACYNKNISYQTGPYKFYGLPGLILKIADEENDYIFEIVSLSTYEDSMITSDNDRFTKLSVEDYDELIKKSKQKPSILFKSDRISFPKEALDKIDKRHKEKLKYENNPIELTDQ